MIPGEPGSDHRPDCGEPWETPWVRSRSIAVDRGSAADRGSGPVEGLAALGRVGRRHAQHVDDGVILILHLGGHRPLEEVAVPGLDAPGPEQRARGLGQIVEVAVLEGRVSRVHPDVPEEIWVKAGDHPRAVAARRLADQRPSGALGDRLEGAIDPGQHVAGQTDGRDGARTVDRLLAQHDRVGPLGRQQRQVGVYVPAGLPESRAGLPPAWIGLETNPDGMATLIVKVG